MELRQQVSILAGSNKYPMKKVFILIVVCYVTACSVTKNNHSTMHFASNAVVAHRGAYKQNGFPENSIASLQQAIKLKCTGSEFDVWMTADDSLVIHHDPTYNSLDIEKTTFNQLRQYRLSNNEPLPSLREYLLAGMKGNNSTRLVLEIKPSRINKERGTVVTDKVIALIRELHCTNRMAYISFDYDIVKHIHQVESNAITQYLNGDKAPAVLKADGISGLDYHYSVFKKNPQWIQEAKQNKLQLNAWTVDDSTDMRWLLDSGFDFITTNQPEMLLTMVKNK